MRKHDEVPYRLHYMLGNFLQADAPPHAGGALLIFLSLPVTMTISVAGWCSTERKKQKLFSKITKQQNSSSKTARQLKVQRDLISNPYRC